MAASPGAIFSLTKSRPRSPHAREQRPWALMTAALLLAILAVVLWVKWAENRNRAARLEVEIQTLRVERARMLKRLESAEAELLKATGRPGRGEPSR